MRRVWWMTVVLMGCGPSGAAGGGLGDAAALDPRVVLGTGTSAFVTIPDEGAELELIAGPQGGWHVDLTARIWDLDLDRLRIRYEALPIGGTAPISVPTELELSPLRVVREGDHWLRAGDFLQMDVTNPAEVVGMELDVSVYVRDLAGRTAQDTRRARIVDRE
jgi:hypothetical protein